MTPVALAILLLAAPAVDPDGAALFAEANYAVAAGVFEASWSAKPDPVALVWAGRSRLRAGHAAHAVTYLTHALSGVLPDELRKQARADLEDARARTHAAQVSLGSREPVERLTVVAQRTDVIAPALHHALAPQLGVSTNILVLELDPGEWILELRRAGTLRVRRTVKITATQPPIQLSEPRAPPPPPRAPTARPGRSPDPRTRLALAGGLTGAAISVLGASLFIRAQIDLGDLDPAAPCDACSPSASFGLRSTGTGLLGAGIGVLAASHPALIPSYARRRIVWSTELALGALAVVSGVAIAGRNGADFNSSPDPILSDTVQHDAASHSAGTALLGLGLGLTATATVALIADAVTNRKRRGPRASLAPTPTGVVLTGRF